jgi:hypothetical protein
MPQINILNILQGDNQSTIVDKVNYNFDQILSAGGGPQGQQGLIGPTGPIGPQGVQGVQGLQGPSGTKWFVQDTTPASGSVLGNNPFLYPTLGDYWLDPDSADQDIWVFAATGWVYTGYGLAAGEIFQKVTPINIIGGGTGQSILISGTAGNQTITLSDASIQTYTPGGTAIDNLNYENSKLKLSTKDGRDKIISFSRSDYDTGVTVSPKGTTASIGSLNSPRIEWDSPVAGTNYFDISFTNPTGAISIKSLGTPASGGVNLLSSGEISAQSNSSYILLKTLGTSGTYVSSDFLELGSQVSTPVHNPVAPFFANATGVGIGLGTGGFLQSGNDSRKLAVKGNLSVGRTSTSHTSSLFVGSSLAPNNNNKGTLFSEGFIGVGATSPTGSFGGSVLATGPSESQGRFSPLWVTSPNYGPGIQVKTLGSSTAVGRTVIGDGVFDFQNSGGIKGIAGTGPDLSQEYFTAGEVFTAGVRPLISYQHKITDASNTTGTAPVFGITTFTNGGVYGPTTIANKTTIQTRNSNQDLTIQSNGGTLGFGLNNKVSLGASFSNYVTVYGGPSGSSTGGTVTIGSLSDSIQGVSGSLTGGNSSGSQSFMRGQALTVTGITTVGTNYPWSLFNSGNTSLNAPVGNLSMLKIHRNLYTSTSVAKGGAVIAGGNPVSNYPNGIEITSYRPSSGLFTLDNTSVAFAVGSTDTITTGGGLPGTAAATGFFISDTGQNVSIGTQIIPSNALTVQGNVGVTGEVSIVDNGVTNISTITISSGSDPSPVTSVTIPAVNYDRVIYLVSMNTFGNTAITAGSFHVEALIGGASIFYKWADYDGIGTTAGRKTNLITNGNFILPALVSAEVETRRYSLSISGPSYLIYVRSHRFGKV